MTSEDTIAAIATPPGEGGIGIVRISGTKALPIAAGMFRSSRGRDVLASRQRVFHGHVLDASGEVLDEVLLHVMRGPHSYTGEDTAEINAHGGPGPLNAVLEEVLRRGARLAGPGEFTRRAFLNGRIDLIQAEAVIDQIRARTREGLRAAQSAAGGALSRRIADLKTILTGVLARIEAAVDFPEEDLPVLVTAELLGRLRAAHGEMSSLLATADAGRVQREGARVAIAGRPNAGKSRLFNALLRDTRAIVSAQPGTTRDRIEEFAAIGGIPVLLVDTAGLRESEDEVEQIGVNLAREAVETAQLTLHVLDSSTAVTDEDRAVAERLSATGCAVIRVWNKVDLCAPPTVLGLPPCAEEVRVSALRGDGLEDLEGAMQRVLLGGAGAASGAMLTRLHQKDSLRRAAESVARVLAAAGASPELLALDLQEALQALGEITGETTPDDILEQIFSAFCIGK